MLKRKAEKDIEKWFRSGVKAQNRKLI